MQLINCEWIKIFTLVKTATATVINYEKNWKMNVIITKKLKENNRRINY